MKRVNDYYVYKVVFIETDFDNLEVMNKSFGHSIFNTDFQLDQAAYQYSKEQVVQGNDTMFDFDKEFAQHKNAFNLLILGRIDLITFYIN